MGLKDQDKNITTPNYYIVEGIECRKLIVLLNLNFFTGNAFKYIWRAGKKTEDALQDLKKARHNLDFEIERLEKLNGSK